MQERSNEQNTEQASLNDVQRIYALWGQHPRLYAAQDWLTLLGRHRFIRQKAIQAARPRRGARILEIGCGTGLNLAYIESFVGPEGHITAFDFSDDMLEAARAHASGSKWLNIEFVQGDAAVLDVGDARFDAVVSVLAMSVVPSYVTALRRSFEVLEPGGTLSVCDASLFTGPLRVLNPALRSVYVKRTGWNPDRDLPGTMKSIFGNVEVEAFNLGSFFVATSTKT